MHIVIMGCGRVGSSVARSLEDLGHSVAVVDRDPEAFRRLGPDFAGRQITGVGFSRGTLREAGIEGAAAFAAVSSGDNSNILSARVARETFGVNHVVARIYDPKRAQVYERLGIPTVATVPWTSDRLLRALLASDPAEVWRDPTGGVIMMHVPLHESWFGREVGTFQEASGARVAYLVRFGSALLPRATTVLQEGDQMYVLALYELAGKVSEIARQSHRESD